MEYPLPHCWTQGLAESQILVGYFTEIYWKWGEGSKIKSNAICEIGKQKQVHSSRLVFFLFFPSGVIRNGIYSMRLCHHLFLCSQGQLLNLHKRPLALVNLHNQMNPNLHLLFCLYILHFTCCLFERFTRGRWLLHLCQIHFIHTLNIYMICKQRVSSSDDDLMSYPGHK